MEQVILRLAKLKKTVEEREHDANELLKYIITNEKKATLKLKKKN